MNEAQYDSIITEEIYKLLMELVENGKLTEYRYLLDKFNEEKQVLLALIDKHPGEVYDQIINEYIKTVKGISQLVPGLTTGIKDAKSKVEVYTYNGVTRENGEQVDEKTRFDIASTTKLFTVVEALKLAESGMFSLEKNVSDYNDSKYKKLQVPVSQMAKFYYELRTPQRLDASNLSQEEINNILENTYIYNDHTFIYSDIPFIILKDIMPRSDEYFKKYFNEEMDMLQTGYDRSFGILTGSQADNLTEVNDPKARNLEKNGINPGHAGIYSTSNDLIKLFNGLYNGFLSKDSIKQMLTPAINETVLKDENGNIVFKKNKDGNTTGVYNITRGMGVYIKHPEGIRANEIVNSLSDEAFSITGFTGSYATFDLKNGISANILANPLSDQNSREIVIDNQKFLIKDCDRSFANGTKVVVSGKTTTVPEENLTIPYTRITNTLKESQIYTLLLLRLAKNVLIRKYLEEKDQYKVEEVEDTFETPRKVR